MTGIPWDQPGSDPVGDLRRFVELSGFDSPNVYMSARVWKLYRRAARNRRRIEAELRRRDRRRARR